MKDKVLVTGHRGFIGRYVFADWRRTHGYLVKGIDHPDDNIDFEPDEYQLVIHLAAWADIRESLEKPEAYYENNLFPVGSFVENVNTGIICQIVSRGNNYVIAIDEHNNIFRTWLKDLSESNNIKGFNFKPAGEIGTDELANVLRQLTPGEFIKKINKIVIFNII